MTKHSLILSHSELRGALEEPLAMVGGLKRAIVMLTGMFGGIPAGARPFVDEAIATYERGERLAIRIEAGWPPNARAFELTVLPDGSHGTTPALPSPTQRIEALGPDLAAEVERAHEMDARAKRKPHGKPKKRARRRSR